MLLSVPASRTKISKTGHRAVGVIAPWEEGHRKANEFCMKERILRLFLRQEIICGKLTEEENIA